MDESEAGPGRQAHAREQICRRLIQERKRVGAYLGFDLCPAPSWDILLDLYLAEQTNKAVQIWSLCIAANVPTSTAHRKISDMVHHGILVRSHKGGRVMVRLASETILNLDRLFDDLAKEEFDRPRN